MSLTYSCMLSDQNSNTFLLVERIDNDWKVFEGTTKDDLTSVKTRQVDFFRDGGTVIALLDDGRIIYIPQKMFPNNLHPIVSKWETRQQRYGFDAMEHNTNLLDGNSHPMDFELMDFEEPVEAPDEPADYSPEFFAHSTTPKGVVITALKLGDRQYV